MNRIENAFKNKPIFMPYFPLGYPDLDTSIDVIEALANSGADLIEVGLSFSDPLADGSVIQHATQVALEKGITVKKSLEAVRKLRQRGVDIPLVLMGYYNPMLAYGLEKFVRDAAEAGADGFIVPDLPMEEAEEFMSALSGATSVTRSAVEAQMDDSNRPSTSLRSAQDGGLPLIQMLAPTTPPERMERIARNAKGFIYLVSVTGITGERKAIAEGLSDLIANVRKHTDIPVCVGFGISTPEQAKEVGAMADGVIVGSACVNAIGGSEKPIETAKQFAAEFRSALNTSHD
ncbi:MAG TPA: tryptophan synthase subunit alpha [Anaerolineales bacterium]|nr:tryptophan synthase subunit alpha [Anaerolineales bacterium]HNQ95309.1 tryptophan synthase subunit alpha [Anaerolineales bacterium]HNS62354.1 tryptophan synthase subunit alpha [Anaerolineales bacterium]